MIFANLRCRVSYAGITLFVLASLLPPSTESSLPWLHVFDWSVPSAHQAGKRVPNLITYRIDRFGIRFPKRCQLGAHPPVPSLLNQAYQFHNRSKSPKVSFWFILQMGADRIYGSQNHGRVCDGICASWHARLANAALRLIKDWSAVEEIISTYETALMHTYTCVHIIYDKLFLDSRSVSVKCQPPT